MKRFITLSVWTALLIVLLAACSQNPTDLRQSPLTRQDFGMATYDVGNALAANSTGVYVVGDTDGSLDGANKGNLDAFLRKYDGGGVVWGQQFGTRGFDSASDVVVDASGNSYVVGSTSGALGFKVGSYDAYLRKYNSSGVVQWTRQFGTMDSDFSFGVALDGNNNVFVVSSEASGFVIRKYNSSGTLLTTKTKTSTSLPGLSPRAIAVDSTGAVVVLAEWFDGTGVTDYNIRVFKFTNTLVEVWNVPFQQTVNTDSAYDIATFGTDIYLTARIDSYAANLGARFGKLNSAGTTVAVQSLEPTTTCNCTYPTSITVDSSGNIYIAGETTGTFTGFTNAGFSDIVAFKYTSARARVWVRQFGKGTYGTTEGDFAYGLAVSNAVYVTGYTFGNLLGDLKYGAGDSDAYLAQLEKNTGAVLGIDQ
jgi:Beta-propeller repeat